MKSIEELKERFKKEKSIANAYNLLELMSQDRASQEELDELFGFIVNSAFDRVSQKFVDNQRLDLKDQEDLAASRGLYEHAIYLYDQNDIKGARELLLALYYLIDEPVIKDALLIHLLSIDEGYSFKDFLEKIVDIDSFNSEDRYSIFLQNFKEPPDILMELFKDSKIKIDQEVKKIKEKLDSSKEQ